MKILNKANSQSKEQVEEVGGIIMCIGTCGYFCTMTVFTSIIGSSVALGGGGIFTGILP